MLPVSGMNSFFLKYRLKRMLVSCMLGQPSPTGAWGGALRPCLAVCPSSPQASELLLGQLLRRLLPSISNAKHSAGHLVRAPEIFELLREGSTLGDPYSVGLMQFPETCILINHASNVK